MEHKTLAISPISNAVSGSHQGLQFFRDLTSLTKPRVTSLVLFTTLGGLWLAPGPLSFSIALWMVIATACGVGAANTLNCWMERDVDGFMERTRLRPLPDGRLAAPVALWFGVVLSVVSVALAFRINAITGLLGLLSLFAYVLVYTPLKRISPLALWVGAIPGALPPLMGWTAITGRIEAPALVLFAILFFWQIPHFLAIAIFRKNDYANAGIRVLPVVSGERAAVVQALVFTILLVGVSVLLFPLRITGLPYLLSAVVGGLIFIGWALRGFSAPSTTRWARSFFGYSLVYLTGLFIVLAADAHG